MNTRDNGPRGYGRPGYVTMQAGVGKQEFPNDPVLEAHRREQLKRAGKLTIRRRPKDEDNL